MGTTHFTGPIQAGSILNTSGTTIGKDVKNVGFAVMSQSAVVNQANFAAAAKTGIVIPANSEIVSIKFYATAGYSGVSKTLSLGTTVTATELVSGADLTAVGVADLHPGTDATRTGKWINVGTSDVAIWALAANTGTGIGRLVVTYMQANN